MGGYNSGRRNRGAPKWDELRRIDLSVLRRRCSLDIDHSSDLFWTMGGRRTGSISYRVHPGAGVRLVYKVRSLGDDEWQQIDELIPFAGSDQHLGGRRKWFSCLGCHRRVRVLAMAASRFRCRHCIGAVYASQYEPFPCGKVNAAQAVRQRMGGSQCLDSPFPPKPKGMHWKTYERLRQRDWDALDQLDNSLIALAAKLERRCGRKV
ncbi:MAG: hypothetical protein V2I43_04780 [Parvularcula sp.]|jgi:hypothetical protein|nr:hypothetical protein [Parvularcula sp.]